MEPSCAPRVHDGEVCAEGRRRLESVSCRQGESASSVGPPTYGAPASSDYPGSVAAFDTNELDGLPFSKLDGYDDNVMINLEHPGLRLVYTSLQRGAPIFEVPGFLTVAECESLRDKIKFVGVSNLQQSTSATGSATDLRTSRDFVLDMAESPSIHQKLAELTGRTTELMEPLKLIKYSEGGKFEIHSDAIMRRNGDSCSVGQDGKQIVWGTDVPSHCNREITVFIYLNTVEKGGQTTFHNSAQKGEESLAKSQVYSVRPEVGKAVLFFPTSQPISGELKPILTGGSEIQHFDLRFTEDMLHRGSPAIDPKEIAACWIWPIGSGIVGNKSTGRARATDGKVI